MDYYINEDKSIRLYNGDCLNVMEEMIKKGVKVEAIIADIPYQITSCEWDTIIPFNNHLMLPKTKRSKKLVPIYRDEYILRELQEGRDYSEVCEYFDKNSKEGMWQKLNKLIKDNGAIVLFGSEPFSSALRMSNLEMYKYDWTWKKSKVSGFTNAKNKPLNTTENISIFSLGVTANTKNIDKKVPYYPQGLISINKIVSNTKRKKDSTIGNRPSRIGKYVQKFTGYPKNLIEIASESKTVHPTQKPVPLMEYLIKTYTNEGETVLDFTAGSFTTGVACVNTNRNFIGIELDEKYFNVAKERILEMIK